MTKLRLTLTDGSGDIERFIIEEVDGVPEIRRERAPVASRDRSIEIVVTDVTTMSVEVAP